MILDDAISLVLDEYPGMKAIGAAERSDGSSALISPLRPVNIRYLERQVSRSIKHQAFCIALLLERMNSGIT